MKYWYISGLNLTNVNTFWGLDLQSSLFFWLFSFYYNYGHPFYVKGREGKDKETGVFSFFSGSLSMVCQMMYDNLMFALSPNYQPFFANIVGISKQIVIETQNSIDIL